jgi:hypothetical protein
MYEVSFSDDNEQDIDYTKYFKCTTIFLTISNLCEEDIRSYFDNIQDDSESDIQDHFSDYELSESENEDMTPVCLRINKTSMSQNKQNQYVSE